MAVPPRPDEISPELYALCLAVTDKRPRTVIEHILLHGQVSTEELQSVHGYTHGPRGARDVREQGIPLVTVRVKSPTTGRMIGAYKLGDPATIRRGRIGGRKAFSKAFKKKLIDHYGERSTISGEPLPAGYLQIDHRVPYEVAGDSDSFQVADYMLLDGQQQRAKSWSCERCQNFRELLDPTICGGCFWAIPEQYEHVAMVPERRLDITWRDTEVATYQRMAQQANLENLSLQQYVKGLVKQSLRSKRI